MKKFTKILFLLLIASVSIALSSCSQAQHTMKTTETGGRIIQMAMQTAMHNTSKT